MVFSIDRYSLRRKIYNGEWGQVNINKMEGSTRMLVSGTITNDRRVDRHVGLRHDYKRQMEGNTGMLVSGGHALVCRKGVCTSTDVRREASL